MEQKSQTLFAEERKMYILNLLKESPKILVSDLCKTFSVSPATVRNDLRDLETDGLLTRTHGGAIRPPKASFELDSYQKQISYHDEKKAIAAIAISLVDDGDTIALDTGSTTMELAKLLESKKHIQILTNDLLIANVVDSFPDTNVLVSGGYIRKRFHCMHGPIANDCLTKVNVDKLFLACNGFSIENGLSTPDISIADFKASLIKIASQKILLCDSSKINRNSFAKFANIDQIDIMITDAGIDDSIAQQIEKCGVVLEIANV